MIITVYVKNVSRGLCCLNGRPMACLLSPLATPRAIKPVLLGHSDSMTLPKTNLLLCFVTVDFYSHCTPTIFNKRCLQEISLLHSTKQ